MAGSNLLIQQVLRARTYQR